MYIDQTTCKRTYMYWRAGFHRWTYMYAQGAMLWIQSFKKEISSLACNDTCSAASKWNSNNGAYRYTAGAAPGKRKRAIASAYDCGLPKFLVAILVVLANRSHLL